MQNEYLKKEEQEINEYDKFIFYNSVKTTFLFNGFLILLAIPICFALYHYGILDNKKILGYGSGIIFVAAYLLFDMYKKYGEIKAGLKISEEVIVTSSSYDFLVHYYLLNNGIKIYKDTLERSRLKKKDISLGTKLTMNYLPKTKFIFSMAISGTYAISIEETSKANLPQQNKSEASMFSTRGRVRRKTYLKRIAIPILLAVIIISIFNRSDNTLVISFSLVILLFIFLFISIQVIKRMHDLDKSGWHFFIPFYGPNIILTEGTVGENKYGEDPKRKERLIL